MPSRDPKTGKEISGAQKRKRKHAKAEALVAAGASAPPPDDDDAPKRDDGAWAKEFEDAGKPDLENPGTDLDYVRRLQLICLRQMATVAFPPIAQQEAWRRIKDMSATVGMTSNRAQLEAKVKKLEAALKARTQIGAVHMEPSTNVEKPANARGMRRGPRPIPPDAVADEPPPTEPPAE